MNDQRPTRWPCSADSSRNAGPSPRSFRNAETGVSQSSMNVSETGTTFGSATAAKEHLLADAGRVGEQLGRVRALGPLLGTLLQRALEAGQRLVRRRRLQLPVVEA